MTLGKRLFSLADFAALQMADFGRQIFNRAGHNAQRRKEHGVTVAGITCVEMVSTFNPSFLATCASTLGSMVAKLPTGPEIAQVAISSRAARRRFRSRAKAAKWLASLMPKLVGSAWMAVAAANRDDGQRFFDADLQRV